MKSLTLLWPGIAPRAPQSTAHTALEGVRIVGGGVVVCESLSVDLIEM